MGRRPPLQLPGRGISFPLNRPGIRLLHESLGLDLLRLHRLAVRLPSTRRRPALRREIRSREVGGVPSPGEVPDCSGGLLRGGPAREGTVALGRRQFGWRAGKGTPTSRSASRGSAKRASMVLRHTNVRAATFQRNCTASCTRVAGLAAAFAGGRIPGSGLSRRGVGGRGAPVAEGRGDTR